MKASALHARVNDNQAKVFCIRINHSKSVTHTTVRVRDGLTVIARLEDFWFTPTLGGPFVMF